MDWQAKLPFLEWSKDGGGLVFNCDDDGKVCYRCKDGTVIYPTDPRLKEYEEYCAAQFAEESRRMREAMERTHDQIVNTAAPEPFPRDWLRKRPRFLAWLNGNDPTYRPTIMEYRFFFVAYQERLRRLNERRIGGTPDTVAKGDTAGLLGWLSCQDLAHRHGLRVDALRKRLETFRHNHGTGWMGIPSIERGPRDPHFLYNPDAVAEVVRVKEKATQ